MPPPPLVLTQKQLHRFARVELANRQRAIKAKVAVEKVNFAQIIIDWNGCCGLCCQEIDLALPGSHNDGLTLEHLHSLGQGGGHVTRNIVPAHRRCNMKKANEKDGPGAAKIKRRQGLKGPKARKARAIAAGRHKPMPSRPFVKGVRKPWPKRKFNKRATAHGE